jgi:hypothetical protein
LRSDHKQGEESIDGYLMTGRWILQCGMECQELFKAFGITQPFVKFGYIEKLPTITLNEIIADTKWIS